jgi:HlyD family type I secretion membrane fusion protein
MLPRSHAIAQWHRDVPRPLLWPTVMGVSLLVAWGLGFGLWAATAPLDGAVVASGVFVATGQNKQVQHLEGGIVREVLVREGDLVEVEQPLVRLDETAAKTKLRRLVLRKYRLSIMLARLEAEMQSRASFDVPPTLAKEATDPEIAALFERQRVELAVRRARQADEEHVLRKEMAALQERIAGYESLVQTMQQRRSLFDEELKDKKALLERQLARRSDVWAIQRAEAGVSGELGDLTGRVADSKERIARAEQQIAQLRSAAAQKVAEELRATESELDDVAEQIRAAVDIVERTEVRSPVRGIVVKLNHHTQGAVVAPGANILELLPADEELIVEARTSPNDISHVREGQDALVRLTALNVRVTPMIEGKVIYVSADAVADRDLRRDAESLMPRRHWFITRVRLDAHDARNKIGSFKATPGMPADVYIRTGERTFFSYILRPLLDSLSRAFREH